MDIEVGDKVWYFLTYKNFNKWVLASVKSKISSLVYVIDFGGHSRRAMRNQLRKFNPKNDVLLYPTTPTVLRNKRKRMLSEPSTPIPGKNQGEFESPSSPPRPRSKVSKYNLRDNPRKRFNSL
jgi:hypothetical protein